MASVSRTTVVEDGAAAAQLFQLAKASGDATEFSVKLQKAGLMAGASSSGGGAGGTSAGGSGGSAALQDGGTAVKKGTVPQLSRELAHGYARDGIVIVTWANFHFLDFTLNWVHHMQVGAALSSAETR